MRVFAAAGLSQSSEPGRRDLTVFPKLPWESESTVGGRARRFRRGEAVGFERQAFRPLAASASTLKPWPSTFGWR